MYLSCSVVGVVVLWNMTTVSLYSVTLRMETAGVSPENNGTCQRRLWSCKQVCNILILTCSMLSALQDKTNLDVFHWQQYFPILVYFKQDATLHSLFISGKLLYIFRVVSPLILRSTHNCIYSIWYLLNRYCYLALCWKSWNWSECGEGIVLICLTSTRYCKYSCVCPWGWVEIPPETCRAVFQK